MLSIPLIKIQQLLIILTVQSGSDLLTSETNTLSEVPSTRFSLDKMSFSSLDSQITPKTFCYAKLFSLSDTMFALYPKG